MSYPTMTRAQAASARARGVAQRADRPSQRRSSAEATTSSGARARAGAPGRLVRAEVVEAADGRLSFAGVASVTERAYDMWDAFGPYTETVTLGAFDVTLARADLDVPLVIAHDQTRRIARTNTPAAPLFLSVDEAGDLAVSAPELDPADPDVAYIVPKLRAGLMDEMSFAFRIVKGWWSDDYTEYRIDEVDMHRGDAAIVGYGANPYTTAGLREAPADDDWRARASARLRFALLDV